MRLRNFFLTSLSLAFGLTVLISSCAGTHDGDDHDSMDTGASGGATARARIEGKSGVDVRGTAVFHAKEDGVLVELQVENAPPGWHAVHVHELGDCSADDGKSAGGHFNPAGVAHGSPHSEEHHAGDLGNMEVKANGRGYHVIFMPELTVAPGEFSVIGRSLIVHADADDLVTQPTGAAGGRIACGVIQ